MQDLTKEELMQKCASLISQNTRLRELDKKRNEIVNQLHERILWLETACLSLNELNDNQVVFCNTSQQVESLSNV